MVKGREPSPLQQPLIVTLTSYPPRFPRLAKTIASLLDQTVVADRTVLWIAEQDRAAVPDDVRILEAHGLEIRGCDDLRSFKKLIPALETWPGSTFVTADDDVYYPPTWLESLVVASVTAPGHVVAARSHLAKLDGEGWFMPYADWQLATSARTAPSADTRFFPTGVGGVLYPPAAFAPMVGETHTFQELCPYGDDIWFFWMARLAGTRHCRARDWFDIVSWPDTQEVALYNDNLLGDRNDRQIRAMERHFGPVP